MRYERPSGKIITFYSYKGGAGRSMALANIAWILASNGKRVLVLDWDLEAPSLHHYFKPFLVDKSLASTEGLIDFLIDFVTEATTPGETDTEDWYTRYADISAYAVSLEWEFPGAGAIDFVPAGRQGGAYALRVNYFNWQAFYERHDGGLLLEAVKEKMRQEYDYIVIDSRTGVGDNSGICTVQMPDELVVCFTLTNQSMEGAAAVAASASEQRQGRQASVLKIFPVPMRVETAERYALDKSMEMARAKFDTFLDHIQDRESYWSDVAFLYAPSYAYSEALATFVERTPMGNSLLASAERLVAYLTDREVVKSVPIFDDRRELILKQYNP